MKYLHITRPNSFPCVKLLSDILRSSACTLLAGRLDVDDTAVSSADEKVMENWYKSVIVLLHT